MMHLFSFSARRLLRICALLLALFVVSGLRAETHYVPHIAVGVHGGMDMGKVTFQPSILQKWNKGITFGVSVSYAEEKLVGLQAELNFIQRGWAEDFEESPLSFSRTLNYIALPLLTHINFGGKRCKCFFNLGPEFAYLLSQTTSSNFDTLNPEGDDRWPEKSRMTEQLSRDVKNRFDYGICAGVGCEFWLRPRNSIFIELRYYYGLGNIYPANKGETFGASRNMSVAATFGYNFRLK